MKYAARPPLKGFTLIELLLVIAIIGVIATISISNFMNYSQSQKLGNAASEVFQAFNTAKSRAQSQVKPASCGTNTFDGYQMRIYNTASSPCSPSSGCYEVVAVCNGAAVDVGTNVKKLPSGVTISGGNPTTFRFDVLTGTVLTADPTNGTAVTITQGSQTKTIRVFRYGRITIN